MLDALLELLLLSAEVRMSNLITNFDDFKRIFEVTSKQINAFMDQIFYENEQTLAVTSIAWDQKNEMIVFGSNTS